MNRTNHLVAFRYTRSGILLVIAVLALLLTLSACGAQTPYADPEADHEEPGMRHTLTVHRPDHNAS